MKKQAREREWFRRKCVQIAQPIHRLDMRLRLGLLQDTAAIDRQIAREAAEAHARKQKSEIPTVKTEAQTRADELTSKEQGAEKMRSPTNHAKPRIRPLSETKAVEFGANFVGETITLTVALTLLLLGEAWSRRKATSRRLDNEEDMADLKQAVKSLNEDSIKREVRLAEFERELLQLKENDDREKQEAFQKGRNHASPQAVSITSA